MNNEKLNVLRQVIEEGFGNVDLYIIDQLVSDNLIEHQFGSREGREGLKKEILSLDRAFTNKKYELISHAINGDIVWVYYKFSGTHYGKFMGHEPTGKNFVIDMIDIARISDGSIVEHWGVPDRVSLFMQLGFFQLTNSPL